MSIRASGAPETRAAVKPIPRFGRGLSRRHRREYIPTLAEDRDFKRVALGGALTALDPDYEAGAWPELIDQSRLGSLMSGDWFEDAEDDDQDSGIEDVPHDSLDEEGI